MNDDDGDDEEQVYWDILPASFSEHVSAFMFCFSARRPGE